MQRSANRRRPLAYSAAIDRSTVPTTWMSRISSSLRLRYTAIGPVGPRATSVWQQSQTSSSTSCELTDCTVTDRSPPSAASCRHAHRHRDLRLPCCARPARVRRWRPARGTARRSRARSRYHRRAGSAAHSRFCRRHSRRRRRRHTNRCCPDVRTSQCAAHSVVDRFDRWKVSPVDEPVVTACDRDRCLPGTISQCRSPQSHARGAIRSSQLITMLPSAARARCGSALPAAAMIGNFCTDHQR